jgi:hypothetical protein
MAHADAEQVRQLTGEKLNASTGPKTEAKTVADRREGADPAFEEPEAAGPFREPPVAGLDSQAAAARGATGPQAV